MEKAEILSAFRFVAVALLAAKTAMFAVVYFRLDPRKPIGEQFRWFEGHRLTTVLGLLLCSFALTLHQGFWWLHEMAIAHHVSSLQDILYSANLVTAVAYSILYVGVALLFSGWLAQFAGRMWPLLAAMTIAALFSVGVLNALN